MTASPRQAQNVIYLICGLMVAGLGWSILAEIPEVASATGTVVPIERVQILQSLEGGAVEHINIHNGDHVNTGDLLVSLDVTPSIGMRNEIREQLAGLAVAKIRLMSLLDETQLQFPQDLSSTHPALVIQAQTIFESNKAELASSLASLENQIAALEIQKSESQSRLQTAKVSLQIARRDFSGLKRLYAKGAAGASEVNAVEARVNDAQGQSDQAQLVYQRLDSSISDLRSQELERRSSFRSKAADALAETQVKIATLGENLAVQDKRYEQTAIRAQISGTVKAIKVTGIGQVIRPGDAVVELVPDSGNLIIQARIKPEDIAFLREGMDCVVKFSAYDYSVFGALSGQLTQIAADSTTDDRGQLYYNVEIKLPQNFIMRKEERWPIKSGMVANIEVVTGQRTVFQYITKPLHRMATMALKER